MSIGLPDWAPSNPTDYQVASARSTLASLPPAPSLDVPLLEGVPVPEQRVLAKRIARGFLPQTDLPTLSFDELMEQPEDPPPMLAPGIPKVGLSVMGGPPKVGKSLRASQVALESGRPVLYVAEEGSLPGIAYRLRRQALALQVSDPPFELVHRQRIRLDDRASVKRLRDHVAVRRPALVIFDPLNRLHGQDENRPSQMTPVMDAMAAIAYDFGCAVLAIHHLAKPSQERRGSVWDRFRGATSIRSGTDANLILDGGKLVGEFRDAEPLTLYLELDREALIFRDVDPPNGGKIRPDELLAFVQEHGNVTGAEVMARFGVKSKVTALAALAEHPALDSFEGARGQRIYFATVQ